MLMKIYGGTPKHGEDNLCESCSHSRIVRGRRVNDEIAFCDAMAMEPVRITFKVATCSGYVDAREPSYEELFQKAWILRPASNRRPAGFVRASELRNEEFRRYMTREDGDG